MVITVKEVVSTDFVRLCGESTPKKKLFVTRCSFITARHIETFFLTQHCPKRFGLFIILLIPQPRVKTEPSIGRHSNRELLQRRKDIINVFYIS